MKKIKNYITAVLCSLFFISCANSTSISTVKDIEELSSTLIITLKSDSIKSDFSKESIKEIETWLGEQKKKNQKKLIDQVAAYLGQSIIKTYGGSWVKHKGNWGVKLSDNNLVFPFGKVSKFVNIGPEDSFYSLFKMIPLVFKIEK